jgi:hypothetical protein
MIMSSGKVVQLHGKKFCTQCNEIKNHTCFNFRYRKSQRNDDSIEKTEKWYCDSCQTEKVVVKEIPQPTEQSMLVNLLMGLSERYELAGSSITVEAFEVKAVFRFPEHDLLRLREIANNWAERGYVNAKHLLMLERAGMSDVANIPPRRAPSRAEARRDAMRSVFEQ